MKIQRILCVATASAILGSLLLISAEKPRAQNYRISTYIAFGASQRYLNDINPNVSGVEPITPQLLAIPFPNAMAEQYGPVNWCRERAQFPASSVGAQEARAPLTSGQWTWLPGPTQPHLAPLGTASKDLSRALPYPTIYALLADQTPATTNNCLKTLNAASGNYSIHNNLQRESPEDHVTRETLSRHRLFVRSPTLSNANFAPNLLSLPLTAPADEGSDPIVTQATNTLADTRVRANGEVNPLALSGVDIGAQINAAILLLGTAGGIVQIPAGSYSFSTTIKCPLTFQGQITIRGAGRGGDVTLGGGPSATQLNYTGSGDAINQVLTSNEGAAGCGLKSLVLDGSGASASAVGFHFGGTSDTKVIDSNIQHFAGASAAAIKIENASGMYTERWEIGDQTTLPLNKTDIALVCDPGCSSSWGHHQVDVFVNVTSGQTFMSVGRGVNYYGGRTVIQGNYFAGSTGFAVDGIVQAEFIQNLAEASSGTPVLFNISPGGSVQGSGYLYTDGMTNSLSGNIARAITGSDSVGGAMFNFDGVIQTSSAFSTTVTGLTLSGNSHLNGTVNGIAQPTLSACGANPSFATANSNDMDGEIQMGSGAISCTLRFATAFSTQPSCVLTDDGLPVGLYTRSKTASSVTIDCFQGSSTIPCGVTLVSYHCFGM